MIEQRTRLAVSGLLMLVLLLPLLAACGVGGTTVTTASSQASAASAPPSSSTTSSPEPSGSAQPSAPTPPSASAQMSAAPSASQQASAAPSASGTAVASDTAVNPNIPQRLEYGAVTHLYYTDAERVLTLAEFAGFDWIRQQVLWKDTETKDHNFGFDELDRVVDTVAAKNKKLLMSVVKSPDWATGRPGDNGLPANPEDYGRFVRELATRYKGKVQAIEVWNEQNYATENGGRVTSDDAGRYVELLKVAFREIKAVDPTIVVVAGALTSTGVTEVNTAVDDITYLKAMYDYNNGEIKNYMDAQGFHPASALNPPEALWPSVPGPGCAVTPLQWCDSTTHYFRHIENVRQVMIDEGAADKQIWITEMGWATENNTPGYEYGNQISYEKQAEYMEDALFWTLTNYQDFVGVAFIWNLNFAVTWGQAGNPLHEQASFGLLNADWSPRPAFNSVQGFINAARQ